MIEERDVEADLEGRFERLLAARGWESRKLEWVGRRGAPDRICLGPEGKVAFVELKNGWVGRLSPHQRREISMLEGLGQAVWVIRDNADILRFAKEVLQ